MTSPKPEALQVQVGGSHYTKMAMQPFEFSFANGWDSCAHTILKYLSRHRDKGGLADVQKAAHTVQLRAALVEQHGYLQPRRRRFTIHDYCVANGIDGPERIALEMLENWVWSPERFPGIVDALLAAVRQIERTYGSPS